MLFECGGGGGVVDDTLLKSKKPMKAQSGFPALAKGFRLRISETEEKEALSVPWTLWSLRWFCLEIFFF